MDEERFGSSSGPLPVMPFEAEAPLSVSERKQKDCQIGWLTVELSRANMYINFLLAKLIGYGDPEALALKEAIWVHQQTWLNLPPPPPPPQTMLQVKVDPKSTERPLERYKTYDNSEFGDLEENILKPEKEPRPSGVNGLMRSKRPDVNGIAKERNPVENRRNLKKERRRPKPDGQLNAEATPFAPPISNNKEADDEISSSKGASGLVGIKGTEDKRVFAEETLQEHKEEALKGPES